MYKVLRGVIEHSVGVFDDIVNRLGGDFVNLFRAGLEKLYRDTLVEYPVALSHVSGAGTTIISCRQTARVKKKKVLPPQRRLVLVVWLLVTVEVERIRVVVSSICQ